MARGAVAVALPYDPRPDQEPEDAGLPSGPGPYLRIGAFASFHRYAALARLLKATACDLSAATGHPYAGFRVAVNSRLPEKSLTGVAGLGCRGRSDLLLTHAYGPACVLGLLLLPFDPLETARGGQFAGNPTALQASHPCASCQACADACPGRAIAGSADRNASGDGCGGSPAYHKEACIQHWMSTMDEPPKALLPSFGFRLYGCDACILACPLSAGAWLADRSDGSSPASRADALLLPAERRPGSFISASFLAEAGDDELKVFFRRTALGLSWLGPSMIRRNAALANRDSGTVNGPGI